MPKSSDETDNVAHPADIYTDSRDIITNHSDILAVDSKSRQPDKNADFKSRDSAQDQTCRLPRPGGSGGTGQQANQQA